MNNIKTILDFCGGSGSWSDPYRNAGYKVINITLPEFDILRTVVMANNNRIRFIGEKIIDVNCSDIYGVLAAPPCTKFSKADWRRNRSERDFEEGMKIVRVCMSLIWTIQENGAPLKFWALENPLGYLYNFLGKPAFYFQPWQFGETDFRATKRTAIWGYFNLPIKTVKSRNCPVISPHTTRRQRLPSLFPDQKKENNDWYKASAEERAKTSSYFAEAFFKANQ